MPLGLQILNRAPENLVPQALQGLTPPNRRSPQIVPAMTKMAQRKKADPAFGTPEAPLKPLRTILDQEIRQAEDELERPLHGIFASGLLAGIGVGASTFALAVTTTLTAGELPPSVVSLIGANAYTVGFIIVILARTDLFTEYTTIAILPVLTGRAGIGALARLWGMVYAGNMTGVFLFSLLLAKLGSALGVIEAQVLGEIAGDLVDYPSWVILLSAILAGWLMGLLSWLIAAGKDTISQIFFIWMITGVIGLAHLHHAITATLDVMAAIFMGAAISADMVLHLVLWTTIGNAIGGVIFAVLIRYSLVLGKEGKERGGTGRRASASE